MDVSNILNLLLGTGEVGLIIGIATLKSAVHKARAEADQAKAQAKKAEAEAETVRITNAENATRILVENIVKPLKEELYATREDLQATKKEMASTKRTMSRLARAVEAANNCPRSESCPVLGKLRNDQKNSVGAGADRNSAGANKCKGHRNKADPQGGDPAESGESDDPG